MQLTAEDGIMTHKENNMKERIINAMTTHCSWSLESLRLEPLESDLAVAEVTLDVMAGSLALDDAALVDFIALVMETRASMKDIMARAERCNWPELVIE